MIVMRHNNWYVVSNSCFTCCITSMGHLKTSFKYFIKKDILCR